MTEVILGAIIGKLSLIKRGDILSIPGAFLLGIELTIPLTREYRGKRELVCDSIIFRSTWILHRHIIEFYHGDMDDPAHQSLG